MLFNKLQKVWMLDVWHTSRHTQPDWLTSLKKKRNVSTIKVSLNGKQKIWKWTSTYILHCNFSPSKASIETAFFRHPKEASAAAPFRHPKVSIGRCIACSLFPKCQHHHWRHEHCLQLHSWPPRNQKTDQYFYQPPCQITGIKTWWFSASTKFDDRNWIYPSRMF